MAESTSASASYSSSSTNFAADTESVVSDCEDRDSGEEAEVEGGPGPSTKVISLLDRLRSPTSAEIARKRKTKANPPPKGKRRCKGTLTSDPKSVSPNQRVREFCEEPFSVSNGHLFCSGCREQVSLKRSVINHHILSTKHKKSKERLQAKEAREKNIADMLVQHNEETHLRGDFARATAGIPYQSGHCFPKGWCTPEQNRFLQGAFGRKCL